MAENFSFDFDFEGEKRSDLLSEALNTLVGLQSDLGTGAASPSFAPHPPTSQSGPESDPDSGAATAGTVVSAAERLLAQLDRSTAELASYPEIIELREMHFEEHGLPVPKRFADLSQDHRFFWVRIPFTLHPAENMPFVKLQCGVEFNPGVPQGYLRPKAYMILPDKKFKQLLEFSDSLELGIGENFEFDVAAGIPQLQAARARLQVEGGVDARFAGKMGLIVGPFKYTWKRALLEHSPAGTEKVFWRLDGVEFFQEEEPTLIVVLQIPRPLKEVQIAAALQVSQKFNLAGAAPGDAILYFRNRLADFFRKGAPLQHTRMWDISTSL